ncbi:MAG: hypothetical protein LBL28_08215 [Treponema sp.]|jgi:hypothetical protein|nr:hypothetical protein [Treponema sp.]
MRYIRIAENAAYKAYLEKAEQKHAQRRNDYYDNKTFFSFPGGGHIDRLVFLRERRRRPDAKLRTCPNPGAFPLFFRGQSAETWARANRLSIGLVQ